MPNKHKLIWWIVILTLSILVGIFTGNQVVKWIVNDKTPNKHFFPPTRSFTYDDQKNEWHEFSQNFYFLEEEDGETYYFNAEDGKNFFYEPNEWLFSRC